MIKSDDEKLKILFFGDLVGKPGRFAVRDFLSENFNGIENTLSVQSTHSTFIIANVENASHGFGLTEKNYNDLCEYGVDCMTSGNHIWDKKEIFNYIDKADKLVRPFNYPANTPGSGSRIFEIGNGIKIGIINLLGRVFMSPVESQWDKAVEEIKRLKEITPVVIVDFHAEATAEKICFGRLCSELGVSAFFGTHTHVQTADEQVMNNMGYITDAGFCGTAPGADRAGPCGRRPGTAGRFVSPQRSVFSGEAARTGPIRGETDRLRLPARTHRPHGTPVYDEFRAHGRADHDQGVSASAAFVSLQHDP